ncbi:MAG TPA: glycine-rich protein [Lapillicoccus sp.]|nr:glycine-rich protein [Lapillicoccus sp.]
MSHSLTVGRLRQALVGVLSTALVASLLVGTASTASAAKVKGTSANPTDTFALTSRVEGSGTKRSSAVSVTIGDKTYTAPSLPGPCSTGVWVQQLDRGTLDPGASRSYAICSEADAAQLAVTIKGIPAGTLAIVNSMTLGTGPKTALTGLGPALAPLGVAPSAFASVDLNVSTFSVVGVAGTASGQAYYSFGQVSEEAGLAPGTSGRASVNGLLARDSNRNFALTSLDFVTYDIAANGDITVGQTTYPVPPRPAGFVGGFHLLVLDRRTLAPVSNTLYSTNNNLAQEYDLQAALGRVSYDYGPGAIVMLASVGTPLGTAVLPAAPSPPRDGCTRGWFTETCRYASTGSEQSFVVPSPAFPGDRLQVELQGGRGGDTLYGPKGGAGASVTAQLPFGTGSTLTAGRTIYVEVGGNGEPGGKFDRGDGGWNGGGDGNDNSSVSSWPSGGGGGASDLRLIPAGQDGSLASRMLVAAGGGGAGGDPAGVGQGGNGGAAGADGGQGTAQGQQAPAAVGRAGTFTAGGAGGSGAVAGSLGSGGQGADSDSKRTGSGQFSWGAGGGGGGGLYGGGGGGHGTGTGSIGGAGGGGGSNLTTAGSTATTTNADPSVTISYATQYGPTMAETLRLFGATPTLIEGLGTQPRYALVGAQNPRANLTAPNPFESPEASPSIRPGATGELQGVLGRGRENMWFVPVASNAPVTTSENGQPGPPTRVNYALYDILAQAPTAWPIPDATKSPEVQAAQSAALTYISQKVCTCDDVRVNYATTEARNYRTTVVGLPFVAGNGFDQPTFVAVQTQLANELQMVTSVLTVYDTMHSLLSDTNAGIPTIIDTAFTNVDNTVAPPSTTIAEDIAKLFLALLSVAASFVPGGSAVIGVIGAVLSLTLALSKDPAGNQRSLQTRVDQLKAQAAQQFTDALANLGQTFSFVVSDWGKLQKVAAGVTSDPKSWGTSLLDQGAFTRSLQNVAQLGSYRSLVTAAYQVAEARADDSSRYNQFCVIDIDTGEQCDDVNASTMYHFTSHPSSADYQQRLDSLGVYFSSNVPEPMPDSLIQQMQASGLFAPDMFLRWPLPGRECLKQSWDADVFSC